MLVFRQCERSQMPLFFLVKAKNSQTVVVLHPLQILVAIEQVQDLLPKIERSRSEPSLHRAVHAEELNPLLFHTTRLLPL